MNRLPKSVGILGAIVGFCAALLAGLLCGCPPLAAARKAVPCAAVVMLVAWVCVHVALDVLHDGLRRHRDDSSA